MDNVVVFVLKMKNNDKYAFATEQNLDVKGHSIYLMRTFEISKTSEPLKISDPCNIMGTLVPDAELYKNLNIGGFIEQEKMFKIMSSTPSYVSYSEKIAS